MVIQIRVVVSFAYRLQKVAYTSEKLHPLIFIHDQNGCSSLFYPGHLIQSMPARAHAKDIEYECNNIEYEIHLLNMNVLY